MEQGAKERRQAEQKEQTKGEEWNRRRYKKGGGCRMEMEREEWSSEQKKKNEWREQKEQTKW